MGIFDNEQEMSKAEVGHMFLGRRGLGQCQYIFSDSIHSNMNLKLSILAQFHIDLLTAIVCS